ncbi:uncharacterized protein PHACADRAFT_192636 [Phanerochaete carnosa HHB-10118-sp]|uniref:Uncharacterized protein n=1 Tax=Phanerochaete carnosa (strain HHB-10118-sp) TaxID=650164 RepID=K5WEJ5_PHACS|nr:uncharacterized protein PHACADRAFT_192636 [Phanerochaete carnosa HHB-10118-sp]EKM57489.1 hypothetical protein PHACADRAFT_192636 [Phanerochaete carnosa HHB-10118-sp]
MHFDLSVPDLEDIIDAWPMIWYLRLGNEIHDVAPTIQLEDLLPFAEHCSYLETFGLHVAIHHVLYKALTPPSERLTSHVKALYPGELGKTCNHIGAAHFVARIFPRAEVKRPSWEFPGGAADIINRKLKAFAQSTEKNALVTRAC